MRRLARTIGAFQAGWLVLAAVTGCASGTPAPRPTAGTVSPAPATVTPASGNPQSLALQAYLGMWRVYVAASRTSDYQSTALAQYAAGSALSVLTHGLYKNYQSGIVTRGQPTFDPQVTVTSSHGTAAEAKVTDCADSSRWEDYYTSGKPAPGTARGRQRIYAWLQPFNGTWKVTYLVVEPVGRPAC